MLTPRLAKTHHVTGYDLLELRDVRNKDLIESFCQGKDAIIYLAGITNNDECERNREFSEGINVNGFTGVVEAAEKAQVKRLIFASSVAAYGSTPTEVSEDRPLLPTTAYGRDKANCEAFLNGYAHIPYIITRSASVCGWSPAMRNDLTVNKMVFDARTKHKITVNGGDQWRCHIHIQDLCEFYALLLEAPLEKIHGQAFNMVERNESVKETANTVAFMVSMTEVEFGPPTDDRSYRVSGDKALRLLGWKPKRPYTDGVRDILAHV
jgi:nucleoside-diphosphate-sugar epimerase